MRQIELLYFVGCPSWAHAWAALGQVLIEERIDAIVRLRDVADLEPGALAGFAGSPTIRVDGVDLFGYTGPPVMACRWYADPPAQGWPSIDALRERLTAAAARTG